MKTHRLFTESYLHGDGGLAYPVYPFICKSLTGLPGAQGPVAVDLAKRPDHCPMCGVKLTPDNCEGYHETQDRKHESGKS